MTGQDVIKFIGLDRAKSVKSKGKILLEGESIVLSELAKKDLGVDSVYFNTDENGNSFPSIFLNEVKSFDEETFHEIAKIHRKIWNYKKVLFFYVYSDTEIRIYNCSEKPLIKTKEDFNYERELQNLEIVTYHFSDTKHLEDRGATEKDFYSQIKTGAKSYFDILEDPKATYQLYERLE